MKEYIFIDSAKVRSLRIEAKLSQQKLAQKAGLALRTISALENPRYDDKRKIWTNQISLTTAEYVAKSLGVRVEEIGFRITSASHHFVPAGLTPTHQRKWRCGNSADMAGNHELAVDIFQNLEKSIGDNYGIEIQAALADRLVQALDHKAEQLGSRANAETIWREAIEVIGKLRGSTNNCSDPAVLWVTEYQAAILHRQLARFDETELTTAENLLTRLKRRRGLDRAFLIAADYQLAAIELDVAIRGGAAPPADLPQRLESCRAEWEKAGAAHRAAYVERSLAHLCELLGDYRQALLHYFEAARIFAAFRCDRYLKIVQAEFKSLLNSV